MVSVKEGVGRLEDSGNRGYQQDLPGSVQQQSVSYSVRQFGAQEIRRVSATFQLQYVCVCVLNFFLTIEFEKKFFIILVSQLFEIVIIVIHFPIKKIILQNSVEKKSEIFYNLVVQIRKKKQWFFFFLSIFADILVLTDGQSEFNTQLFISMYLKVITIFFSKPQKKKNVSLS